MAAGGRVLGSFRLLLGVCVCVHIVYICISIYIYTYLCVCIGFVSSLGDRCLKSCHIWDYVGMTMGI